MKFDASIAGFILGLVCASSGWIAWWINKLQFDKQIAIQKAATDATKAYAAERDFNHLRNNQLQISDGIAAGFKEMEHQFEFITKELSDIKAYLIRHHDKE